MYSILELRSCVLVTTSMYSYNVLYFKKFTKSESTVFYSVQKRAQKHN